MILTGVQGRVLVGNDNNTTVKKIKKKALRRLSLVLVQVELKHDGKTTEN